MLDCGALYSADLEDVDVRLWQPEDPIVVDTGVTLPDDIPAGDYQVTRIFNTFIPFTVCIV